MRIGAQPGEKPFIAPIADPVELRMDPIGEGEQPLVSPRLRATHRKVIGSLFSARAAALFRYFGRLRRTERFRFGVARPAAFSYVFRSPLLSSMHNPSEPRTDPPAYPANHPDPPTTAAPRDADGRRDPDPGYRVKKTSLSSLVFLAWDHVLGHAEKAASRPDAQTPICGWIDWRVYIGGIVVFAAALSTFPLYYSNQNTKFLHGLAQAFPNRLGADWTAGTVDGLPVFSSFVFLVTRFGHPLLFHATELVLLGCFVGALLAIGVRTSPSSGSLLWFQTSLAAMIAVVAKKEGFDGVADQYLIGGYLQPSEFGVLFIVALALALYGRGTSAVLAAAAPAALLPAYMPIAAIIVGAIVVVGWRDHRALPPPLVSVVVFACLIVPEVDLALRFAPTDPDLFEKATRVLAIERIPYHSIPSMWFDAAAGVKLLLAVVALGLAPPGLLRYTLSGLFIYAVGGTLLVIATKYSGLMILAPWRASVIIVPVSIVLLVGRLLDWTMSQIGSRKTRTVLITPLLLVAIYSAVEGLRARHHISARPADHILFVREHHEPTDLYLTDPSDETFRLAAMTAQFISWKTHPYLDREIMEWQHRIDLARAVFADTGGEPPLHGIDCPALRSLLNAYPVTHVLLDAGPVRQNSTCPFLRPWFEGQRARILRVNRSAL
jgi:hypothetical protein